MPVRSHQVSFNTDGADTPSVRDMIRVPHCTKNHLDGLFDSNSLWYLSSEEFVVTHLIPLGKVLNTIGGHCLDVGCAEGYVSDHTAIQYTGMDASEIAIARARKMRPKKRFIVGRLEDPPEIKGITVVLFGGVFSINVRPEFHHDIIQMYHNHFGNRYTAVYDLVRIRYQHLLNKSDIKLVHYQEGDAGISKDRLRKTFLNKRRIMVFEHKGS